MKVIGIAALEDLKRLPDTDRVLLVLNDLAIQHTDRPGFVLSALQLQRPVVSEIPCRAEPEAGPSLFCTRLVLFGPASQDSSSEDPDSLFDQKQTTINP